VPEDTPERSSQHIAGFALGKKDRVESLELESKWPRAKKGYADHKLV
jgi:hypothetical protein